MGVIRSYWFPICLSLFALVLCLSSVIDQTPPITRISSFSPSYREGEEWRAPSESEIPFTEEGELIRYGKDLIVHTAKYFGPKGRLQAKTNGMNCQNCHVYAGTQNYGNPFSAVAATYPRYRHRSGKVESLAFRINDCMQRSMNGDTLAAESLELKAMEAYINWVGKDVPQTVRPKGAGTEELTFLNRPADPQKGKVVYITTCLRCHGENGEGLLAVDSVEYIYPPLWGNQSFNVGAGMYRLGFLAGFIKNNMPFGINRNSPALTDEQAWDVAAFIASQPRPVKVFTDDWKDSSKKPYDFPFAPYADSFSEQQHKYGPFAPIRSKK